MSENIRENTNNQAPDAAAAENAGQPEKMFTQDEVNRIVSDRLARDREKRTAQQTEDTREQELNARESRLDCRAFLAEKNYPAELLELLDTSDVDKFKAAAEKLHAIYHLESSRARFVTPEGSAPRFTVPNSSTNGSAGRDPIRDAFKP